MTHTLKSTGTTWFERDLEALRGNYAELSARLPADVLTIASVKANGYGLGAVAIGKALEEEGVYGLATGSLHDAIAMREAGVGTPILLFAAELADAAGEILSHDLTPTLHNYESAHAIAAAATTETPVYLKVDAGLGRIGMPLDVARDWILAVAALPNLTIEGIYTHLPFEDEAGMAWARGRLAAFHALLDDLAATGIRPPITQSLATSGVSAGLRDRCSAVCPGHMLYGLHTVTRTMADMGRFRPVGRALRTRLIQVVRHAHARGVGLGGHARVEEGTVLGIVPIGQGHGYRSSRGRASTMAVRETQVPVAGVSLEHVMLDLTQCPAAEVGDVVTVFDAADDNGPTLEALADSWEVSPLEVLLSFSDRVPIIDVG